MRLATAGALVVVSLFGGGCRAGLAFPVVVVLIGGRVKRGVDRVVRHQLCGFVPKDDVRSDARAVGVGEPHMAFVGGGYFVHRNRDGGGADPAVAVVYSNRLEPVFFGRAEKVAHGD